MPPRAAANLVTDMLQLNANPRRDGHFVTTFTQANKGCSLSARNVGLAPLNDKEGFQAVVNS